MQLEDELVVPALAAGTEPDGERPDVEEDDRDPAELTDAELVARADERHRRITNEQRELLRDLCAVDDRKMWPRDGARDLGGWIAARYGYSPWEGRRWAAASRNVPPWLMTHLRFRDQRCTFAGCGLVHFVEAHHMADTRGARPLSTTSVSRARSITT